MRTSSPAVINAARARLEQSLSVELICSDDLPPPTAATFCGKRWGPWTTPLRTNFWSACSAASTMTTREMEPTANFAG
jgi:hypothetical protein